MSSGTKSASFLSTNTTFRLLTFAFIIFAAQLGRNAFSLIVVTIGFTHYILAVVYSRRRLSLVGSSPKAVCMFVLMVAGGVIMAMLKFPIAWLSLIHHNFNEVYMRDAFQIRSAYTRNLRTSCVVLNCMLFLAILHREPAVKFINHQILFGAVGVSALWYFGLLLLHRRDFSLRQLIDNSIYEICAFGVLALSMSYRVTLGHMFLYHFVFWGLYPIPNMLKKPGSLAVYAKWHLVLIPVIATLFASIKMTPSLANAPILFGWFGYIHITSSLVLSKEQPSWIIGFFQKFVPQPAVPVFVPEPVPHVVALSSR